MKGTVAFQTGFVNFTRTVDRNKQTNSTSVRRKLSARQYGANYFWIGHVTRSNLWFCIIILLNYGFLLAHILEILRTADINLLFDGMIYATGSIKFLAANTNLHEELLEANCVECFVDLLRRIREMV